jgi:hypothetical protein
VFNTKSYESSVSLYLTVKYNVADGLGQGGPTFVFPRAKNSFPVGPKNQETPSSTIFEN